MAREAASAGTEARPANDAGADEWTPVLPPVEDQTSGSDQQRDGGAGSAVPDPFEQRYTRYRNGDTVVLYDRLEQTTWVQADYHPEEIV